jgi:glycosyltransferase involved in cell wall biosynthesis
VASLRGSDSDEFTIVGGFKSDVPLRLSVAIITYNQRDRIAALLDDLVSELGTMTGVEVIVSDDGSQDGTQDLLRDYAARWPHLIWAILGNRNVGIWANANRVRNASRGAYVAPMAGDDRILSGKFRRQMDFLDHHPDVGVCYHDVEVIYDPPLRRPWLFSSRHCQRRGDAATVIRYGAFFPCQSVMGRRAVFQAAATRPEVGISGDSLFYAEALANTGSKIDFIPGVYMQYIRHDSNVTTMWASEIAEEKSAELGILSTQFPQYERELRLRRSDHEFILAIRSLFDGRLWTVLRHLGRSLVLGRWTWPALGIAFVEARFFVSHRLKEILRVAA